MTEAQDDYFTCAALISAADRLIGVGELPASVLASDESFAMWHLNAWAIPKGLKEAEAFDAVNRERERLLASLTPEEIGRRAKKCVESMKGQS
jgi:hypothetical protein